MKTESRINAIECLRFIFIILICCWHFESGLNFLNAGYLGVEFFFILSGFFMYDSIFKKSPMSVTRYTIIKLKKFYFQYIIALILIYVVNYKQITIAYHNNGLFNETLSFIKQILLLQDVGPFGGGYNLPTWFFSILIWGGGMVYVLTKNFPKFSICILFPFSLLMFLTVCMNDPVPTFERWGYNDFIPWPLIRGIIEIGYGVSLRYLFLENTIYLGSYRLVLDCSAIISIVFLAGIILLGSVYIAYSFIFIPFLIISAVYRNGLLYNILKSQFWNKLGKLSFTIFLIHYPLKVIISTISENFEIDVYSSFLFYLALLIPCSYFFNFICNKLQIYMGNISNFINVKVYGL